MSGNGKNGKRPTDAPAVIPEIVTERPMESISAQKNRWGRMGRYLEALRLSAGDPVLAKRVSSTKEGTLSAWRKWDYELESGETFEHAECQLLIEGPLAVLSVVQKAALAGDMNAARIYLATAPDVISLKHHVLQRPGVGSGGGGIPGSGMDYAEMDVSAEFADLIVQAKPPEAIEAEVVTSFEN